MEDFIMKKFICLLMATIVTLSMTGCNTDKKNDLDTQTTNNEQKAEEQAKKAAENGDEKTEQAPIAGENTFDTENGTIRLIGVEKGDPDILRVENAYVVKYEVTNKAAEPREGYEIFYIDIYQNNVEVEDINSTYGKDCEQDTILGNRHKGIMTGGTLTVGVPVVLEDTSQLTLFIRDGLDLDNKTSLTLNVD